VLLPNDTHRKLITSITAILLPVVTYLLTLARISHILIMTEFSHPFLCIISNSTDSHYVKFATHNLKYLHCHCKYLIEVSHNIL
jgi:hypothetical protein